jgi:site-specific DNA-cytosine methylase
LSIGLEFSLSSAQKFPDSLFRFCLGHCTTLGSGAFMRRYMRRTASQCLCALERAREMLTNYDDVYETFDDDMRDQCGNAFV